MVETPQTQQRTHSLKKKKECRNHEKNYVRKKTLPSFRNQDWSTVKSETEKVNDLLTYIPTKTSQIWTI